VTSGEDVTVGSEETIVVRVVDKTGLEDTVTSGEDVIVGPIVPVAIV